MSHPDRRDAGDGGEFIPRREFLKESSFVATTATAVALSATAAGLTLTTDALSRARESAHGFRPGGSGNTNYIYTHSDP